MPTFDGGHCFLTTLIPIDSADVVADGDGAKFSHVQMVRNALSVLPTAQQSPATDRAPCNSPFARCSKTHFARLVVLDDVVFNGRMPENSLVVAIKKEDPTAPEPVDTLPCPYLLFTADFDAPQGTAAELRDWLRGVWTKMRDDLDPVFEHCFQYADKVKNSDSFADYMIAHQLETTMPFNDYWPQGTNPPLPSLSLGLLALIGIAVWAIVSFGLWWLFGLVGFGGGFWRSLAIVVAVLIGLFTGGYAAYARLISAGLKPFPMAPNSDLSSILKGMYLQRRLIPLVAKLQGHSDEALFDEIGKFLDAIQVDNLQVPTQAPGTIGK